MHAQHVEDTSTLRADVRTHLDTVVRTLRHHVDEKDTKQKFRQKIRRTHTVHLHIFFFLWFYFNSVIPTLLIRPGRWRKTYGCTFTHTTCITLLASTYEVQLRDFGHIHTYVTHKGYCIYQGVAPYSTIPLYPLPRSGPYSTIIPLNGRTPAGNLFEWSYIQSCEQIRKQVSGDGSPPATQRVDHYAFHFKRF